MGTWVSRRAKGWMLVMDRSVCKAKSAKWELERLHTPLIIETALLVRLANEKQLLASIDQSLQCGGCKAEKKEIENALATFINKIEMLMEEQISGN